MEKNFASSTDGIRTRDSGPHDQCAIHWATMLTEHNPGLVAMDPVPPEKGTYRGMGVRAPVKNRGPGGRIGNHVSSTAQ